MSLSVTGSDLNNAHRLSQAVNDAESMVLKAKIFLINQSKFIEEHDDVLHKIVLIALGLNLLYMGGFTGLISFAAGAIGEGAFSAQIRETLEKVKFIWQSRTVKVGLCAAGFMLFASQPWYVAAGIFGIYMVHLLKEHHKAIIEASGGDSSQNKNWYSYLKWTTPPPVTPNKAE